MYECALRDDDKLLVKLDRDDDNLLSIWCIWPGCVYFVPALVPEGQCDLAFGAFGDKILLF